MLHLTSQRSTLRPAPLPYAAGARITAPALEPAKALTFNPFTRRQTTFFVMIWLVAMAAILRVELAARSTLWVDEVFSLSMATGHSLEHKAAIADASKGDYVEHRDAVDPAVYRAYAKHDPRSASPARVIHAVFESDTSPPLYYLVLYAWTRVLGTSDMALRSLSIVASLACFPLIWWIARQLGGVRAAVASCALFTFSPTATYYSTEGRMYSLFWLFTLCTMALSLRMWRRGSDYKWLALWILSAAGGLLTHYFFAFVFAAICAGLILFPKRASRLHVFAGAAVVALLIAPWYVRVPASLGHWRVTDYWLNLKPWNFHRWVSFLYLPWSYLSLRGDWGVKPSWDYLNAAVFVALGAYVVAKHWRRIVNPKAAPARLMLLACIGAACVGLLVFDLWRKTYVVNCPRYAHAGFPAAILLVGVTLGLLPALPRRLFLGLIVLVSFVGTIEMFRNDYRLEQVEAAADEINATATANDVVVVSSIPSGVVSLARHLDFPPNRRPQIVSWVGQLRLRTVPDDVLRLARGHKRVFLVRMHEVGWDDKHEDWLWRNTYFAKKTSYDSVRVDVFEPKGKKPKFE